jgi:dTDP-4-dehydrorhamnose reductase
MKPTILLTGKSGQVGGELLSLLPRIGETIAPGRADLDLADPAAIRRVVRELRPALIVNAAAYTAVDQAESEEARAHAVNAVAPGILAEEAKTLGVMLVHYSTDYVFDGAKRSPYEESDPTGPLGAYGRTKLAGEEAIRATGAAHLIFRTEWVYARTGRNFLLTILRLATQREELRIVSDQTGAPTWSRMIAAATVRILERCPASELAERSGIYHLTAAGETTWYGFARAILEECADPARLDPWFTQATAGRRLMAKSVLPIATLDYPTPAWRPPYSVLSNRKLRQTFALELPDWRAQLHRAMRGDEADLLPEPVAGAKERG